MMRGLARWLMVAMSLFFLIGHAEFANAGPARVTAPAYPGESFP